jgi:LCP family protein required for cell wall assembly
VVSFVVFWVVLSAVLFFISASDATGNLPGGAATQAALSGSGPMLLSANNILVLGLDNRPTTGYSSKEKGANYSEADANTDSIMIWRLGGGVSRRLSIARDTLVEVPGCGMQKINAAWSCGGPKETIQVVEKLTGIKINHLIVVDLGNFPKFIDDIGGVTVKTPRICSTISGGAADGGFSLDLSPGYHHLDGTNALTLARTRENSCDAAYDDFNRQKMQQEILNAIKSQLFSLHAFIHLPWAAWDAPRTIQTDMGPLQLMEMFAAAEIGGSAPARVLTETSSYYNGEDVQLPSAANVRSEVQKLMTGS